MIQLPHSIQLIYSNSLTPRHRPPLGNSTFDFRSPLYQKWENVTTGDYLIPGGTNLRCEDANRPNISSQGRR
jgi:hypothetical protein